MTLCHPTTHRTLRRLIRRHTHHAIAGIVAAGCAGAPVAVLMLPPAVAVREPAPVQPVPEPGGVWVVGVGVIAIGVLRRRKRSMRSL